MSVAPINDTFGDDLFDGLGIVARTIEKGVQAVGSILGTVGSTIFGGILGPLLKILMPIIVIVVLLIFVCCCIQYHPNCSRNKQRLPEIFQAGTTEAKSKRAVKKRLTKKIAERGLTDLSIL